MEMKCELSHLGHVLMLGFEMEIVPNKTHEQGGEEIVPPKKVRVKSRE